MENSESNEQYPEINFEIATVSLLLENKAYLKTMLEVQEKILAHLQGKEIKEVMKESDDVYKTHLKEAHEEAFKDFNVNNT